MSLWFLLRPRRPRSDRRLANRRLPMLVGAGGIMVIALLWMGIAYHLRSRHDAVVDQTHRDVRNLAVALEQQVERLLIGADQVLRFMQRDFERNPDAFRFEAWTSDATSLQAVATQVSLYDADGELVAARSPRNPVLPRFNVRDRDYFKALAERPDAGLYIDRTLRGRLSGRHVLQLARALRTPRFAGVIVVSLDAEYIAQQFKVLDVGTGGSIALFGLDGYIRARHPASEGMYARDATTIAAGRGVFAHVKEKPAGTYQVVSAFDGAERIFGYRVVGSLPLVVTVGKLVSEVMAPLEAERRHVVTVGFATSAVILGCLTLLVRELERRQRREARVREVEAALRSKTGHLDVALAAMDQGLIMIDPHGTVQVANRRAAELLCVPESLMTAHPTYRLVREQARRAGGWGPLVDDTPTWILGTRRQSENVRFERRTRAGQILEIRSAPTPDGGVVQTLADVTDSRRADAALREGEARYRMLAENTSDVITRLDLAFKRTYVSPSCRRLFGHVPEEMLGDQPSAAIHPEDAPAVRELAGRLAAGDVIGDQTVTTYRARHERGHWIWIEASLHLVRVDGGTPDSIVCVLRDAGVRKADEAALLAAREQAEAARAEAERASAAKSEFLAAMSHEIRTPLNAVIGFSDLLAHDPSLGPRQRHHTERVRNAAAALLTVVDDILDFSKVEAGAMTLHPRPFSPAQLIDNAVSIVRAAAERKGLTLTVECNPGVPARLVGDEDRLRQVLLNLLNNALKFTDRGGVTLAVAVEAIASEACALRVRVSDTGVGVAPDQLERLFRRFSQVDGTHARGHGGTGLGLAISKRLVELMGGAIGVESRAGVGSTFWFRLELPIASDEAAEGASGSSDQGPEAAPPLRLLLVDDLELNRELAGAVLERAGHRVDFAADGREAVRIAAEGRHDLVLMDMQMPGMDGLEAARRIRGLGTAAARVPILAMTANVLPDQVAACRAAGMDGHVGKPFRHDALLDAIARHAACAEPPDGAADAAPLDRAVLDDLKAILGIERVERLLDGLHGHLRARFEAAPGASSLEHLIADAHATASAAGQLGFVRLSVLCRQLETACAGGRGSSELEARVRDARAQALRAIEAERRIARAA